MAYIDTKAEFLESATWVKSSPYPINDTLLLHKFGKKKGNILVGIFYQKVIAKNMGILQSNYCSFIIDNEVWYSTYEVSDYSVFSKTELDFFEFKVHIRNTIL